MATVLARIESADLMRISALRALLGLVLLWLIAFVIDPRTLALESLLSMAPFIGILGVAAIGQHLVIQQRGFDLSVAGSMSLAAVIVTALPPPGAGAASTLIYTIVAVGAGALIGLLNGLFITWLRVPSLVVTIGSNALTIGCVFYLTAGAVHTAPDFLTSAANAKVGPISVLFLAFIVISLAVALVVDRTYVGRRFIGAAVNPDASRILGVHVSRYNIVTYCIAGLLFSLAGVMLAGLAVTPTLLSGAPYMLTTVAAVIVGGSPLNGDRGSILATMIGAVFLILLNQLVVALGFDYAIQSIVQAAIILAGVTVPEIMRHTKLLRTTSIRASKVPAQAATQAVLAGAERKNAKHAAVLQLIDVHKIFGSTVALAGVNLEILGGEIHAIIGENGAGKSTLISIAAGVMEPSAGTVKIAGNVVESANPNTYRDAGISVAFQHPPLPPHLTVLECISLACPSFAQAGGAQRASELIDRVALNSLRVSPTDRIANLSIGQRHVVEIARALASKPKIFVLDEPTEPFKEDDVAQLFKLIRELKAQGVAIIYISHRLNEVEEIADQISVLRDGELIDTRPRAQFTREEIIGMIVGRPLGNVFPKKMDVAIDTPAFRVENLSGHGFHDINFQARRGEIIGLAGVEGQGQRELMRALAGLEKCHGSIQIYGQTIERLDRSTARRSRIAFVPDDRHLEGLFLSLSVEANLGAGSLDNDRRRILIDRRAELQVAHQSIRDLKIKTASSDAPVSSLSGGNQQKVLIGREIATQPVLFLADEPTKGVDIGAKSDIYHKFRELAEQGITVVIASSDGVELEGLCDRVLVMARGSVTCELTGDHITDEEITAANLTATHSSKSAHAETLRPSKLRSVLEGRSLPPIVLLITSIFIMYAAASSNDRFLSAYNLGNVQIQLATLALISFGQLFLVLLGEIDFSVGPLAGFVVVLASYWMPDGVTTTSLVFSAVGILLLTTLIGLIQGVVVVLLNLPSIVVTLAGFFALQGLSLALRPNPTGDISSDMISAVLSNVGPISTAMVVAVVIGALCEYVLFKTHLGRSIRASGSHRPYAHKLGVNRSRLTPLAFAINGLFTGIAGLILAATVGVGSGTAGVNFTLMSVTAVVLGGAVISGGAGSFIATLFGALLVQTTMSATTFMQVGVEWQYWLVGMTTLLAAGLFAVGRRAPSHH